MINESAFASDPLPPELRGNAQQTIEFANEILDALPELRFTSGYRNAAHNRRVNGVPNSLHVQALAADFVPRNGVYSDALLARFRSIASPRGYNCFVHDAGSGKHIHSEFRGVAATVAGTSDRSAPPGDKSKMPVIALVIGLLALWILTD